VASAGDAGVSKHFFVNIPAATESATDLLVVCAHLKSGFQDRDCHQREAQATILRDALDANWVATGMEAVVLGDFNDVSTTFPDSGGKPTLSRTIDILTGSGSQPPPRTLVETRFFFCAFFVSETNHSLEFPNLSATRLFNLCVVVTCSSGCVTPRVVG